jgi:hypothetical protein
MAKNGMSSKEMAESLRARDVNLKRRALCAIRAKLGLSPEFLR